jgi:hypothetical protein
MKFVPTRRWRAWAGPGPFWGPKTPHFPDRSSGGAFLDELFQCQSRHFPFFFSPELEASESACRLSELSRLWCFRSCSLWVHWGDDEKLKSEIRI